MALDACLVLMKQHQNGVCHWPGYDYEPVSNKDYDLQMDKHCFYFSQPEF